MCIQLEPGKPGTGTNEGVLANFFNSLLSKKTGTSPGGTKPAGKYIAARSTAIGLYRENAIAIESEARDPKGGNVCLFSVTTCTSYS